MYEERLRIPRAQALVAKAEDDHDHPCKSKIGAIWLEAAKVRQIAAIHLLRFAGVVEADISDAHDDVVDDSTSSR